ncbi:protein of unknown function [Streptococcus thermophilus]|nr:protein of unknown function [Streptococcus thermophilus]CAD0150935.1 protein of unknown function [Streptococcus thermophilus]
MRHQTNRKYADRKKLNRKYHSQKAYRKEKKVKRDGEHAGINLQTV